MHEIDRLSKRFRYAIRGLAVAFRTEQSFRIQVTAMFLAAVLTFWLRPPRVEVLILILVTALVLVLELVNSIFERVVDLLKPRIHHYVEEVKDMMAASVLVASFAALVLGIVIFLPLLINKF